MVAQDEMAKIINRALVWFRRDLRLSDHRALSWATKHAGEVVCVFVFDEKILAPFRAHKCDRRITFIAESLQEMRDSLRKEGSDLVVLVGDPVDVIPKLAFDLNVGSVFFNRDYEPYAKNRDSKISQKLEQAGVKIKSFKDHVIFEASEVLTQTGGTYRKFTPYSNAWLKKLSLNPQELSTAVVENGKFINASHLKAIENLREIEVQKIGFEPTDNLLKGGETSAIQTWKRFQRHISSYHESRNIPFDEKGTSHLSVYFRFGNIAARHALHALFKKNQNQGEKTWVNEIIWRDFFQMILDQFPYSMEHAFNPQYEKIKWPNSPSHFQAWCEGRTGFPIVDAAMRCLVETGWMHNRLRMIVASFLVKDCLVDWRWGEKFFAKYLLDYDAAANVGGWQWSASTGCDAQPYFRIFNPSSQSEKFDPKGDFIKKWCPELKHLSAKDIHQPQPGAILEHDVQRKKALELLGVAQ